MLYACVLAVVVLGIVRGTAVLAALGLCAALALACRSRPPAGLGIERDVAGRWTARSRHDIAGLRPAGLPTLLPWVVHLPFTRERDGARHDLWVFRDAVTREQWRQLRVRLVVCWQPA